MSKTLTRLQHLLPNTSEILSALKKGREPFFVEAHSTWGSLPRLTAASVTTSLQRPLLYITAHIPEAFNAQDDLETLLDRPVQLFPAAEAHETDLNPTSEIACQRLQLCQQLTTDHLPPTTVIVAPVQALMQPVPDTTFLENQSLKLNLNKDDLGGPDQLAQWLIDHNFERVDQVDLVGEFAQRGGIVDIFSPGQDLPLRIEFFGDHIESMRFFDLDTQRSARSIKSITVASCKNISETANTTTLFSYLPHETLLIFEDATDVTEIGRIFIDRLPDPKNIFTIESIFQTAQKFDILYLNRFSTGTCTTSINMHAQSVQRFENPPQSELDHTKIPATDTLDEIIKIAQDQQVYFFCEKHVF